MEELDFINTHLGGHKITIAGLREMLSNVGDLNNREWIICEIGCGGGDNMLAIQHWCKKNKVPVQFIGIDINPYCIEVASAKLAGVNASFIISDYFLTNFKHKKPDFIFSSLFCHHFTNEELVKMLGWMAVNAQKGFFINDLHRHPLAFYSIKLLTKFFSRSYLVKNDAPLSVLRGFTKKEWRSLLEASGIRQYAIHWKWAFRHLITVRNRNPNLQ
jgi:ubiquinone/menaquinone biosynthesis C-methylase UbiE